MAARDARRQQILHAASEEFGAQGFERATMSRIARRAGASKETLYAWFGDKAGLASAVIEAHADQAVVLPEPDDITPAYTLAEAESELMRFAAGLLALLTGQESVSLNRAAMASPMLARTLREAGRGRTGPAAERYLARLHELGIMNAPDPKAAFRLLYGLVIQDAQIQALLGEAPPSAAEQSAQAADAVCSFLRLSVPD